MPEKRLIAAQKYSGLLGILVLWTCILIGMSRAGLGLIDMRPISYLGVDPLSAVWFSSGLLISAVLFISFGFYVVRTFEVKNRFLLYLIIGQIGQSIAAITPYGMQSQYKLLHTIAAFILAFSLPFLIRYFMLSQTDRPNFRIYSWLFWLELITFAVGMTLFIFTKGIAPLGQALPAIGFHLWIIIVTVISVLSSRVDQNKTSTFG